MAMQPLSDRHPAAVASASDVVVSSSSGLSWAAIIAGAVAAAATSAIMLATGSGIGFAALSPSAPVGSTTAALAVGTVVWLIITQWMASGVGGYLAGRLRTRWPGTHGHEVFFRDTAHGFLAWALATLVAAAVIATSAATTLGAGMTGAIQNTPSVTPFGYDTDRLFRNTGAVLPASNADARMQAERILATGMVNDAVPPDDAAYLGQLVVQQTGVSAVESQRRVEVVIAREQEVRAKAIQAAEAARKAAARLSIFTALSMLIGAFIACVAAALGGHQRELHP